MTIEQRDAIILRQICEGETLASTASKHGISTSRVRQVVDASLRRHAIRTQHDAGEALIMPNRAFFAVVITSGKPRDEINMGDVREAANFLMSHKAHRIGKVTTKSITDFVKANSAAGHSMPVLGRGAK